MEMPLNLPKRKRRRRKIKTKKMKSMQLTLLLKVQTLLVRIHPKPHLVKKKLPERSNLKLPRLPNALSKVVLWSKISSQV